MSAGNASAAIGLANTNKQLRLGAYVQDTGLNLAGNALSGPGPSADGNYIGCSGSDVGANGLNTAAYWNRNVIEELVGASGNPAFTVPANSGVAAGKTARWTTTGASPMTVAADGLCSVSADGVITATATTGLYKVFVTPATVIPAGSFLWAFLV
jgi:hypothetical protein